MDDKDFKKLKKELEELKSAMDKGFAKLGIYNTGKHQKNEQKNKKYESE